MNQKKIWFIDLLIKVRETELKDMKCYYAYKYEGYKYDLDILHSENKEQFLAYMMECFIWANNDGHCHEYDFGKAKTAISTLSWKQLQEFISRQDEYTCTWEVIEDFDFFTRIVLDYSIRK